MATLTFDRIPTARQIQSTRQPASTLPSVRVAPSMRLTRRGERVVAATVVLLTIAVFYCVSAFVSTVVQASQSPIAESVVTTTVTVASGDTLWDIAADIDPSADPRVTIDRIERLNAMAPGSVLQAGQTLVVPVIN